MPKRRAERQERPARRLRRRKATKRDTFVGFQPPGCSHEGRLRQVPRTLLTAFGGGVSYDDGADWAEGEPEEMTLPPW